MPWVEPYVFANDRLGGWWDGWMVGWTGRVVMGLSLTPRKNRHLFKVINGIERKITLKTTYCLFFFNIPAWSASLALSMYTYIGSF